MAALVIVCICALILLLYIFRVSAYSHAIWKRSSQSESGSDQEDLKVSLLIPFRNEAENLGDLIEDIHAQNYSPGLLDVIFIDDHSEDDSVATVERLKGESGNIRIIHLPKNENGKKAAISAGVKEATGEWIIQTDADCRILPGFIAEHARASQNDKQVFVAGPVQLRGSANLWNKFEVLEFMSLTGSTMGSFLTGKAVMCNGANISYSKEFYLRNEEALNKINSPSGDDMFLLARAKKEGMDQKFLLTNQSTVLSDPAGSPMAFLRQRIRWGSKARYYSDFDMIYLALITFLANASILGFLIYGFVETKGFILFGTFLLLKSMADLILIIQTTKHLCRPGLIWYFPMVAILYYFYLVIAGILSLVSGYRWKGRKY